MSSVLAPHAFRPPAHSPQDNVFSNQGYPSVRRIALLTQEYNERVQAISKEVRERMQSE